MKKTMPDWIKPMKLIENCHTKGIEIDSSKVPEAYLFMLGYDKYHPAPKKLPGLSLPGPGIRTAVLPFMM